MAPPLFASLRRHNRRNFVRILFFGSLLAGFGGCGRNRGDTRWTMINVCGKDAQADCHLLSLADGSYVLIDPADAVDAPGSALAFLKKKRVKKLRLVVISHFHLDHYGRLLDFIEAGIEVERVAINLPGDRKLADRERPWGCDYDHVLSVLGTLTEKKFRISRQKRVSAFWRSPTTAC